MTRRPVPSTIRRIGGLAALVDGAVAAAFAVETGHRPSPIALGRMGLPANAFDSVRMR